MPWNGMEWNGMEWENVRRKQNDKYADLGI
jgi:hypothetical protein